MATLPTLDEAERAILDVFQYFGTRPGSSIKSIALVDVMRGPPAQFVAADLNAAILSMHNKGWIDVDSRPGFYILLDPGFEQV